MLQVVVVNYNCHFFLESLAYSLKKTSYDNYVLNVCDNGSGKESIKSLNRIAKDYKATLYFRQQSLCPAGAVHHAEAVEYIIANLNKDDYCLVIDVDCFMLKTGWDQWLMRTINNRSIQSVVTGRIFGTDHEIRANPYLAFFKVDTIRKENISFKPDLIAGSKDKDFGYELNKLNLKYISIVNPSSVLYGLPKKMINKSMDFVYKGEIIASHLKMGGRGLKDIFFKYWDDRCKLYLKKVLHEK